MGIYLVITKAFSAGYKLSKTVSLKDKKDKKDNNTHFGESRKLQNIHPWTEVMTRAVWSEEARVKIQY